MRKTSAFNKLTAVMVASIIITVFAVFGSALFLGQSRFQNVNASETDLGEPQAEVTLTNTNELALGDVNGDQTINMKDVLLIHNHLNYNTRLLNNQLVSADVNEDGKVDLADEVILGSFVNGTIKAIPYTFAVKSGDVNLDGAVDFLDLSTLKQSQEKNLGEQGKINADVNLDGIIDSKDVRILEAYLGNFIDSLPCKTNLLLGDVNLDNEVNSLDVITIKNTTNSLSNEAKLNADVNYDNQINSADATVLQFYLEKLVALPYVMEVKLGDINLDGKIDALDRNALKEGLEKGFVNSALLNADLNADSEVDYRDWWILSDYVAGFINALPYTTQIIAGDVNLSGVVNEVDVEALEKAIADNTIQAMSLRVKLSSDVNLDGEINKIDVAMIKTSNLGGISSLPCAFRVLVGDVNLDKVINSADLVALNKAVNNESTLNPLQVLNSDITGNGTIDKTDVGVLKAYLDGKVKSLPFNPDNMTILDQIAQGLGGFGDWIVSGGEWIYDGIIGTGEAIYDGIKGAGEWIYNGITSPFSNQQPNQTQPAPSSKKEANPVASGLVDVGNSIIGAGEWVYNGFIDIGEMTYDGIIGAGEWIYNGAIGTGEFIYDGLAIFGQGVLDAGEGSYDGIIGAGEWLYNGIIGTGEFIYDGLAIFGQGVIDAGEGIYDGIAGGCGAVGDFFGNLVK